jgi:hypothetical protein
LVPLPRIYGVQKFLTGRLSGGCDPQTMSRHMSAIDVRQLGRVSHMSGEARVSIGG